MFKGLRTKIESEQKGQTTKPAPSASSIATRPPSTEPSGNEANTTIESVLEASSNQLYIRSEPENEHLSHPKSQNNSTSSETIPQDGLDSQPTGKSGVDAPFHELKAEILSLNNRLDIVTKQKEDCNDQNVQLYLLIEKLRRNLETEKKLNANLISKVTQLEQSFKDGTSSHKAQHLKSEGLTNKCKSISQSVILPSNLPSTDNIDVLNSKLADLQAQLSERNRQMRIKQQNLNDIKKALQKEVQEHIATKEELVNLQDKLKLQANNDELSNCKSSGNGSTSCDFEVSSDKYEVNLPQTLRDMNDEDLGESLVDTMTPQIDRMSYASRSSASVDDLDTKDVQQSGNSLREINHEYLKNVLFRYMTSTDAETSHHLIKALSVIMEFNPEQSAAIKRAMHARTSWLRLK